MEPSELLVLRLSRLRFEFALHHRFPNSGCCQYQSTFDAEIHIPNPTALCPGPIHVFRTFPPCHAIAVENGAVVPLINIPVADGPNQICSQGQMLPIVVLFYTQW